MSVKDYEQILYKEKNNGYCSECNKYVVKFKTFKQTINPLNKNKNGDIKTKDEILKELRSEAEAWKKIPVIHGSCKEKFEKKLDEKNAKLISLNKPLSIRHSQYNKFRQLVYKYHFKYFISAYGKGLSAQCIELKEIKVNAPNLYELKDNIEKAIKSFLKLPKGTNISIQEHDNQIIKIILLD